MNGSLARRFAVCRPSTLTTARTGPSCSTATRSTELVKTWPRTVAGRSVPGESWREAISRPFSAITVPPPRPHITYGER